MKHHQAFATLRDQLANLYSDEASARRVCRDAGLDIRRIAFSTRADNNWTAILDEAEKQSAITTIVSIAQKEYGAYQPLQAAIDAYGEAWVTDPQTPGVRATELAYLAKIIKDYEFWAQHYTPLAGIAEVRHEGQDGLRLDQPVLFMPSGFDKLAEHGFGPERRIERVPVGDLREAVRDERRLVLLGEPGAGKTTTLWRLVYDYALAAQSDEMTLLPQWLFRLVRGRADTPSDPQVPLPLLVPLGGYNGDEPALDYTKTFFGTLAPYLPAYLRHQRVLLLLDGLNEMPLHGYRERVGRIQALLDAFSEAAVVVTCRALDYIETLNLQKLEIKPLDPLRQLEYIQLYLGSTAGERLFTQMAGHEIARLWEVWRGAGATWQEFWTATQVPKAVHVRTTDVQNRLWERLRQGDLPPLLALGRNPYTLRMMVQVYDTSGRTLPANRARLFAAFAETLLAREAKKHDPAAWPGEDAVIQCLAQLAFTMQHAGEHGTAVDEAWAKGQLAPHTADPAQVLYLAASATLLDRSGGQVRFMHQLLQEYFAARALKAQLPAGEFRAYWPNGWTEPSGWEETVILLGGLETDLKPLVERLLRVHPVLAARVIADSGAARPPAGTIQAVQDTLVTIATSTKEPMRARNLAGDALNLVGDPRPGVGLTPGGLPDIAWCDVPAGPFKMGNTQETDPLTYSYEAPQHDEPMPAAYCISRYPITNAQYAAFVEDGGYSERWRHCWTDAGWKWRSGEGRTGPDRYGRAFDLPNHPVVGVIWYEAYAFCGWLSAKLGLPVSLPTEAQWEKAARGTDGRRYPWGPEITPDHANYDKTGIDTTSAAGIFPRGVSPYGAFDMSGNMWEWCLTKWRGNYTTPADDSPQGDAWRVFRGSSFYGSEGFVRCAVRDSFYPGFCYDGTGFRVVVSPFHP